jgi:hypothetical protein
LSLNKHIDYSARILFIPVSSPIQTQPMVSISRNITYDPTPKPSALLTPIPSNQINTIVMPTKKEAIQKKTSVITPSQSVKPKQLQLSTQPTIIPKTEVPVPFVKETTSAIIPHNAHVSHNYKEVEALRRTALLQKELVNYWKPPVGTPKDISCEISFFVDAQGTIKNSVVTKSSGVMMYDISARQALCSMKMPQWTYKKTLTINFTQ